MGSDPIRLHLLHFSSDGSKTQLSVLVECIHFVVSLVRDFIENAVGDFIRNDLGSKCFHRLNRRHLRFTKTVTVHKAVIDLEKLLDDIRAKPGHHVCFLSGNAENGVQMCVDHRVAVVQLVDLGPYSEVLQRNVDSEVEILGLTIGAALHEIGHLLGAFHSTQGIMSQRPNATGLLPGRTSSVPCFFDSYSICIFAHGPFFNHSISPARPPSVTYKIGRESVEIKCKSGILLAVVIKETSYRDLKVYNDDLVSSISLRISEDSWDLIVIYNALFNMEYVIK
ncbi:unnamed protein product [Nippostrongylus brasiliensis]|uniref:Peptidase M12B domain-containing protein n=1 Tax=Nippostrongylus brasiliensis TaxID=27835 RepID=A0A0N4XZD7_NIPBR|nr:hypothetical protein Q1695_000917 [Nippostrongylus brasiliensis]VDL72123.1 unnamed protein product [Nippostrongylus brasiliensis]